VSGFVAYFGGTDGNMEGQIQLTGSDEENASSCSLTLRKREVTGNLK
jgi:hypothetical protein